MDNDILKVILVLYFCLGISFAFGELVELVVQRVMCFFTKTECEYRGKIVYVYSFLVIFLWPILLLSLILQIFFKKTYVRMRLWIESKCLKYSKE